VFAAILSILLAGSFVSGPDAKAIRHNLEARYQHARTLRASFFERYTDGNGGALAESGTVYFSRPGRMRWEYESPEQKLFLVDGANAWFYIPADHTASRAKMKESSDWRTPIAVLAGKADLSQLCRSLQIVGPGFRAGSDSDDVASTPEDTLLRCMPRSTPDTGKITPPYVLLETDPQARLVRIIIREPGNAETEFRFGNWEENIVIPEVKFHFEPPPGVAVVDESGLFDAIH
jgi:outer membrane lipoprotein carrier protein